MATKAYSDVEKRKNGEVSLKALAKLKHKLRMSAHVSGMPIIPYSQDAALQTSTEFSSRLKSIACELSPLGFQIKLDCISLIRWRKISEGASVKFSRQILYYH